MITICIGVISFAFAAKVVFVSIGTSLYVQPLLAAAIIGMILALGLTLVAVHTELRMLTYFDSFLELQSLNDREKTST